MHEKLDFYDVLGVLVPGVLIVCAVALAFPALSHSASSSKLPDAFAVIGLTAASIFAGYLAQALASLIEPALDFTWGGRLSARALSDGLGDRYFSKADGNRIRAKLLPRGGVDATDQSLFFVAMQIAEGAGATRVARFNALYAYHRALVLLAVIALGIFIWSFWGGLASHLSPKEDVAIIIVLALLLLLFWYRTKQRGIYYVREVLFCAERQLDKVP